MRYKVQIKDTIVYSGNIDMSEEEYEKLCLQDGDVLINEVRNRATFTDKWDEEELIEFYCDK